MYEDESRSKASAYLDPIMGNAVLPPLAEAPTLLQGVAQRLLLATSEAVSHVHADALARELARATLDAAASLLRAEAAIRALGPSSTTCVQLSQVSSSLLDGVARGAAPAVPPAGSASSTPQTSTTGGREDLSSAATPPSLLSFQRLERILLRVRSVLQKQARAVENDLVVASMLRKHVSLHHLLLLQLSPSCHP
jgi:hypothetical protein